MALITKNFTFSTGAVIVASEHNSDFDVIYADYNGNITNANISASAAITDTKLGQITTASKVSGAAITLLTSLPSGAGAIPIANIPTITLAKGGTGQDLSTNNQGDVYYDGGSNGFTRLTPGTAGQVLKTAGSSANPSWVNALAAVADYGSSATASTARQATAIKVAFGYQSISGGGTQAITNLAFSSSTSFVVIVSMDTTAGVSEDVTASRDSGSQVTLKNQQASTRTVMWFAIGI